MVIVTTSSWAVFAPCRPRPRPPHRPCWAEFRVVDGGGFVGKPPDERDVVLAGVLLRYRHDYRHGSTEHHATASLPRRRDHRRRPGQADQRFDAAGAVTRPGRPSGAGVS